MHLYITFIHVLPTITKTQQLNNVSCELYVSHREPLSLSFSLVLMIFYTTFPPSARSKKFMIGIIENETKN